VTSLLVLFFLGAMTASFAGVVAGRLHTGESWVSGRSRCDSCNRTLKAADLVPVLSWIVFLGRCSTCRARVPFMYPAFEGAVGAVFVLMYSMLGFSAPLVPFLISIGILAFIVLYDLRHTIVPPISSFLLIFTALVTAFLSASTVTAFAHALICAALIGFAFFALYFFSRGRAMGLGDAPVAFALAVLVSPYAFAGLLFSFWSGAVIGIVLLLVKRGGPRMGLEVPFVPFLALGFLLAYFIQWNPLSYLW
jgi:prepilin signal peptidase PulO-like enzyme (type II secretory pathway)